jgi:hypothetical protein
MTLGVLTMDSNYQDPSFKFLSYTTNIANDDDGNNQIESIHFQQQQQSKLFLPSPHFNILGNRNNDNDSNIAVLNMTNSFNSLLLQPPSAPSLSTSPKPSSLQNPTENFLTRLLIESNIPEKNHEVIYDAIEKWKQNISLYLTSQTSSTSINEIYSRVPNPANHIIPKSIKLMDILKYDVENRFYVTGEGSSLKIKYNFKLSTEETELLQSQWRDSISKYLSTQSSAISLSDIGANVVKPFHLPSTIKLLETIQNDAQNRFVISGVYFAYVIFLSCLLFIYSYLITIMSCRSQVKVTTCELVECSMWTKKKL